MTKQELEKAIENKDTVWYIDSLYDTPKDMLLNGIYEINSYISEDVGRVYYLKDVERNSYYRIDYIFKTQAQAKHYSYHSNIARLETLPFMTWEEFLDNGEIEFNDIFGQECLLYHNSTEIILSRKYWVDLGYTKHYDFSKKSYELNEANFYKAYDECVRLFRGEE